MLDLNRSIFGTSIWEVITLEDVVGSPLQAEAAFFKKMSQNLPH